VAGILFAVIFGATLILVRTRMPEGIGDSTEWLHSKRGGMLTATKLMPFAGITFLWFIAVVRDRLGDYEDRFFATVFLGSGLLFLAMMFVSTAVAGGLVAAGASVTNSAAYLEVTGFGSMIVVSTAKTYAIRMAAVFMISLATIWRKTGLMPRWLVAVTYLVALGLLVAGDVSMWLTMAFPIWVLVVSGLLLVRTELASQTHARR
jgi:hypothetical protein